MFGLVENRLFFYVDDSTLLAVVRKPADRPAVATFLNRDLARIQKWCNYWCMILKPVTVSPPFGDLVLSGISIRASPNLDILGVKFDSKLNAHLRRQCALYCFPCPSENWYFEVGEMYICGHLCVTSLLFCICSPNPPWELFSGVGISCWMSALASWAPGEFRGQALFRSEFLVVVSSMSSGWASYVVQGWFEL